MTKFDETTIQSCLNWTLRAMNVDAGKVNVRARVDKSDTTAVLVFVPHAAGSPFKLLHELNRRFAMYSAKYRASLDSERRHLVVRGL